MCVDDDALEKLLRKREKFIAAELARGPRDSYSLYIHISVHTHTHTHTQVDGQDKLQSLQEDYANLDAQVNKSNIENQALRAQLKILTQQLQGPAQGPGAAGVPKITALKS